MEEEWRQVVGYETRYEVSSLGRIRATYDTRQHRAGRFLKCQTTVFGYRRVELHNGVKPKQCHVHRLVVTAFIGPILDGTQVNHINGVKTDNRAENLEIVTPRQNTRHAIENGLKVPLRGSRHGMARLTEPQVLVIAERIKAGEPLKAIASDSGVSAGMIGRIASGRAWTHLGLGIERRDRRSGRRGRVAD